MKFILGKKIEMTERFKEDGKFVAVTAVEAGPCVVTQIKTKEKDGYEAVQIGYGAKRKISKSIKGHLKDLGNFRYLREFKVKNGKFSMTGNEGEINLERGAKIGAAIFQPGENVEATGTSKGKGFAGVVKRHHFKGQPATRGTKDQIRMPGSIGAVWPQHVTKGMRMAGHMGDERVTVKNLEIIEVIPEKNILLIKGAVPGARNSLLIIKNNK